MQLGLGKLHVLVETQATSSFACGEIFGKIKQLIAVGFLLTPLNASGLQWCYFHIGSLTYKLMYTEGKTSLCNLAYKSFTSMFTAQQSCLKLKILTLFHGRMAVNMSTGKMLMSSLQR